MNTKGRKTKSNNEISEWLASKEGQDVIKKADERSKKTVEYLKEARRVDAESLHRPFNM